jgi:hypothetical protein
MASNSFIKATRSNIQFNYGSNLDNESITFSHISDVSSSYTEGLTIGAHTDDDGDLSGARIIIPTVTGGDRNTFIMGVTISGDSGNNLYDQIPDSNTEGKVHIYTRDGLDNVSEVFMNKSENEIKFITSSDISFNNTLLTGSGSISTSNISTSNMEILSNITFHGTLTTSNVNIITDLSFQTFTDISSNLANVSNIIDGGGENAATEQDINDLSQEYITLNTSYQTENIETLPVAIRSTELENLFTDNSYSIVANSNNIHYYIEIPDSNNYILYYEDISSGYRNDYATRDAFFVKIGASSKLTLQTTNDIDTKTQTSNKFVMNVGYSNETELSDEIFSDSATFLPWTNIDISNNSASVSQYARFDINTFKQIDTSGPIYEVDRLSSMSELDFFGYE